MNIYPLNPARRSVRLFLFIIFALAPYRLLDADELIATLHSKEGQVEARIAPDTEWKVASIGSRFKKGDQIKVANDARAGLAFSDGVFLRLTSNASLRFGESPGGGANLEMEQGKLHLLNRTLDSPPTISTSIVSAAIRGTEIILDASPSLVTIQVLDGQVECENSFGSALLSKGEQATTLPGQAPEKSLIIDQKDAVQWMVRYPLVLGSEEAEDPELRRAAQLLAAGEKPAALQILSSLGGTHASPSIRSAALAERAFISFIDGDRDTARELTERARAECDSCARALLVDSYLAQSKFELENAYESVREALQYSPRNQPLLRRAVELALGLDEVKEAREFAALLDDGSASSLITQGFLSLREGKPVEAELSFDQAILQDSSSALSFLGRGLSKIAQGNLPQGTIDLGLAVSLEPTVAIYRSYLGKAFFEADEYSLTHKEYLRALQLDPEDPTPYLYRSFLRMAENRPIEALQDIEASIARNDFRAVYRSSLLLDQDAAVRSANLGRVYEELGFAELARVEAIRSIEQDYLNYSAHLLLGRSTATIFGAETSLSEERIGRLLAPLTFNIANDIGGEVSANDYSALFDKREHRESAELLFDGRDDILLARGGVSGAAAPFAYGLDLSYFMTDGGGGGNYSRDARLRGAFQYEPTSDFRLTLDLEGQGNQYNDSLTEPSESDFYGSFAGLGGRYRMDRHSTFLSQISVSHDDLDLDGESSRFIDLLESSGFEQFDREILTLLDEDRDEDLTRTQLSVQHIFSTQFFDLVSGVELLRQNVDRAESSEILDDETGLFTEAGRVIISRGDQELTSADLFSYASARPFEWMDISAGVSYSSNEVEAREIPPYIDDYSSLHRLNPKFGLSIAPLPSLELRAAYFENLGKSSLEDLVSLEPTTVAGFTQRFNDLSGTEARNVGVGIDFKVPSQVYVGTEWLRRDLLERLQGAESVYAFDFNSLKESQSVVLGAPFEEHSEQDLIRSYLYLLASPQVAFSVEHLYLDSEGQSPESPSDVETQKLAGTLRWFHPSGFFSYARGTYRYQDRENSFFVDDGTSHFWIFDAGAGYRFDKRMGSIRFELLNIFDEDFDYDQSFGIEDGVKSDLAGRVVLEVNF